MKKINFNSGWQYRDSLDNPMMSAFVGAAEPPQCKCLPDDAMMRSKRTGENTEESGIGYFTPGNAEYQKTFVLEPQQAGQAVWLEFEGVYGNAVVEVNGQVAARHRFGFGGFLANITDFLRSGENTIKVTALNGIHPNGRYYTGTGIYRDVHLLTGPDLHIQPDGVQLTTLSAEADIGVVEVCVRVKNESMGHRKTKVTTLLLAEDGTQAGKAETVCNLRSHEEVTIRQRMYVREPKLWSVEEPYLYRYETQLQEEQGAEDTACGSFGIRVLQLDSVHGLRLNGKTVKLKGGCIHSDNGVIGAVSVADAELRRVKLLKEAGYNALRTAHNPVSHAFLDACDQLGMLVMEEYADAWTHPKPTFDYSIWMEDCWEQDIADLVRTAYNHPSVILYSIGNEISDVGTDLSACWGRRFAEKFRQLDPSRYITNGINVMMANLDKIGEIIAQLMPPQQEADSSQAEPAVMEINNMMAQMTAIMPAVMSHPISQNAIRESCDLLDVVGYNYSSHLYEIEHQQFPDRIFVGSETNPPALDENWALVEKHPYVIGDFAWTCWDYIGEPGIGRVAEQEGGMMNVYAQYPWVLAYCGDLDITGWRRPVSYWREIIWGGKSHTPYIAVQRPEHYGKELYFSQWSWTDSIHSWTWNGYEGKPIVVETYGDADEMELFLNGCSLGRKAVGQEKKRCYCKWETTYTPGRLEAAAYRGGTLLGRSVLQTAEGALLTMKADRTALTAGSNELVFAEVEYRDAFGTLDMDSKHTIQFSTEGPLELMGCGSADPKTAECYLDTVHASFEGRAIAVCRSRAEQGMAKLTATDETGTQVVIELEIK